MRVIIGYIEVRMGYTRELYTGAIYGSKNGPYMRVIIGYIWEPYMEVRMGYI